MRASRFNIVAQGPASGRHFVVNLLGGQADELLDEELAVLRAPVLPSGDRPERAVLDALVERGYVVEPEEEQQRFRQAYLDFVDDRDREEVQLFYAPTYACNFACDYCYQRGYDAHEGEEGVEAVAAFLRYVDRAFASRRKYVTLFGGEPLLPGAKAAQVVAAMVDGTRQRGLDLAVVTNGYTLLEHLPRLMAARIREIQVTLDGPEAVHDRRRPLRGGSGTFAAIAGGIDEALRQDLPVNLRVVVDRDNLESLPELSQFASERGWTAHPRFKTQIGRNYELHGCHSDPARLYGRLELAEALVGLARRDRTVLEFHRPALSISRVLFEQGELPAPLFDACPACKTEWAFDFTGHIYPCTATVGKADEAVGRFHPDVELWSDRVAAWQERDVLAIDACRGCELQLACGGGCGAVAKNRTGELHRPDCRPVRELIELGQGLYGPKET